MHIVSYLFLKYLFIVFLIRLAFCNKIGYSNGSCYLLSDKAAIFKKNTDDDRSVYKIIVEMLVFLSYFIISLVNLIYVFKLIYKSNKSEDVQFITKIYSKLKWYPITQLIISVPSIINSSYYFVYSDSSFILDLIVSICYFSSGFFYALTFSFTTNIRKNVIYSIKSLYNKEENQMNKEMRDQLERMDTLSEFTESYDKNNNVELSVHDFNEPRNFSITSVDSNMSNNCIIKKHSNSKES